MRNALLAILTVFVLALGTPVKAQSLEDGLKAYDAGDYSTAFNIWLPLAKQGDPKSQMALGYLYEDGDGAPQDYGEALRWYIMAAAQGHIVARYNIGLMHYDGKGVQQDYQKAAYWYRMAAELGYAEAQHNLGAMYAKGQGVLQDFVTAHMWINIASANGLTESRKQLTALTELLTKDQIFEAQARARKCLNSDYQDCD